MRILLVEANTEDARLIRELLREGAGADADLEHVDRLATAMVAVAENEYDVVLLDLSLPDSQGLETLTRLRTACSSTATVILSGHGDEETALGAVQQGAQDYLVKGSVDGDGLVRALRYAVGRQKLLLELQDARAQEQFLAYHDPLTGLPNRKLFHERLKRLTSDPEVNSKMVGVLFLDLDRFKSINDTLGHDVGDVFLQEVAKRLSATIRESDTAARLGGDEFALILYGLKTAEDAAAVAKQILEALTAPVQLRGHTLHTSGSIGISLYPFDGHNVEDLTRHADIAMYSAKSSGKNTFRFYDASMDEQAKSRLAMEAGLRLALEREEFTLHYQPQVNLQTGLITTVEALMRWDHPEFGLVSPREFIPVAEDTRLIHPIGEWALRAACTQNKAWQNMGLPAIRVAVNFSALQFRVGNAVSVVASILRETGLDAAYLELEMAESALMQDRRLAEVAARAMEQLSDLGVHVSVDDFGTGYSSLTNLKNFPVEKLKIDKSFVAGLPYNEDDLAITSAMINLAGNLGLRAIAEGVETEEQLACLRELGCDDVQGYLIGHPAPAEHTAKLLAEGLRLAA